MELKENNQSNLRRINILEFFNKYYFILTFMFVLSSCDNDRYVSIKSFNGELKSYVLNNPSYVNDLTTLSINENENSLKYDTIGTNIYCELVVYCSSDEKIVSKLILKSNLAIIRLSLEKKYSYNIFKQEDGLDRLKIIKIELPLNVIDTRKLKIELIPLQTGASMQ